MKSLLGFPLVVHYSIDSTSLGMEKL
jgi:hypothetical protein